MYSKGQHEIFSPPCRHRLLPWLYAVLTAVCFAFIFLSFFRISETQVEIESEESEPPVIMLSADDEDEIFNRRLAEWVFVNDPSIMVRSHETLGLSAANRQSMPLFLVEAASPEIRFRPLRMETFEPRTVGLLDRGRREENFPQTVEFSLPEPSKLRQQNLPARVIWRLNQDHTLESPPEILEETVREMVEEAGDPERPTLIEISRDAAGNPRYRIRQSSANIELDQLALQTLREKLFGRDMKRYESEVEAEREDVEQLEITLPGAGEKLDIEIEWRLALE